MPEYEERPTVIDDSWVWYAEDRPRRERLRGRLSREQARYLDRRDTTGLATRLLEDRLAPGDLVVVPLMSGALMLPAIERVARRTDIDVLVAPLSKHPFVTLSADREDDLFAACELYERMSVAFMAAGGPAAPDRSVPRRVVLVDSSTAVGQDAALFFERIAGRRWPGAEQVFLVLVNAIGGDESVAPGLPPQPKARRPDACAISLSGFDPLYVSHLRFLANPGAHRAAGAAKVRAAFPRLTLYWDQGDAGNAHVDRAVERTRASSPDRTHARTPRSAGTVGDALSKAVTELEDDMPVVLDGGARTRRQAILG